MAQISNCLKLISKIDERDQDALVARLDELQAQGMPAEKAQIQAAIDVLTGIERQAARSAAIPDDQDVDPDQPDIKRSKARTTQDVEVVPSTLLGASVGGKRPESRFDVYLTEPATKRRPELRGRPVASIVKYEGMDKPVFTSLYPSVIDLDEDAILNVASGNPRGGKASGAVVWSTGDIKRSATRLPAGVEIVEVEDGFDAMKDGKRIGRLRDNLPRGAAEQLDENASVDIVKVDPEFKGQGVGSALYDAFNEKHGGRIAPSGKTSPEAWALWKRKFPEKVDAFVEAEAGRIRDGADQAMVIRNITDPEVERRVAEAAPEQVLRSATRQTDTPEFKAWFKGSKVVDEAGSPMIVYHGRDGDFSQFNTDGGSGKTSDTGAFFSSRPIVADTYATGAEANVAPVYLSLQKPAIFDAQGKSWNSVPQSAKADLPATEVSDQADEDLLAELEGRQAKSGVMRKLKARKTTVREIFNGEWDYADDTASTDDLARWARKQGYDGVIILNVKDRGPSGRFSTDDAAEPGTIYVAFRPEQIKSAIGNRGTFDPNDASITRSIARPEFFSQLQRSIEQVPDRLATMAAPQWKLWLDANASKLGIKKDEIEFSGVKDYLTLRGKDKVSRDELVAYLDDSGVRVQEVVLGNQNDRQKLSDEYDRAVAASYAAGGAMNPVYIESLAPGDRKPEEQALLDAWNRVNENPDESWLPEAGNPKYGQYTVPGGENYREVLITLPTERKFNTSVVSVWDRRTGSMSTALPQTFESEAEAEKAMAAYAEEVGLSPERFRRAHDVRRSDSQRMHANYKSSHWDQPNVLAHIRVDDRVDADGNKVLFINEIQSDWGQDGKKKGFKGEPVIGYQVQWNGRPITTYETEQEAIDHVDRAKKNDSTQPVSYVKVDTTRHDVSELQKAPRAPFVTDTKAWAGLALKRAIMMAVEGGYDKVALITGEQAADLYDLSKRVESVLYEKVNDKDLWEIEVRGLDGETIIEEDEVPASRIEELIGKELAQKIINGDGEKVTPDSARDWRRLSGLDLKVGGEGMRAFYDQIIPQVARDVLKKLGGGSLAKVDLPLPNPRPNPYLTMGETFDPETAHILQRGDVWQVWVDGRLRGNGNFNTYEEAADYVNTGGKGEKSTQLGFDITPAMREKVASGVPLFSKGRTASGADWESPSASKFDDLVYKFQDKQIDTKRVVEAIKEAAGAISDDLNVYLNEELYHGRTAKRTEDFLNMELNPLIEDMAKAGMTIADLEEFLHARHAKEANAVIAQRNPGEPGLQDGGSGMTNAEADNYMATLPAADRQKLEAAAAKVDAIIADTRKMFVDYELESQATVDGWNGMFKHYVPLQREDKEGSPGLGQGFSIKGKETKGRTGSTRKVVDILANIAMQRERAIVRGEKNRVAQSLVGLVRTNENPDFWLVDEVPTERVFNPATGLVEDRADPMYKSRENAVVAKIKDPSGAVREHAVLFNEDDPRALRMAKSLKNLDAPNLEGLLGVSAKITRYFAAISTQYNPVFGVTNLVRDVQAALINLSSTPLAGDQKKIAKYTASALAGIYGDLRKSRQGKAGSSQWAQLWEEFQNTGGQTGYRDLFRTSGDRAKAIEKALNPTAWMDNKLGQIFTAGGVLRVPMAEAQKGGKWLFDLLSDYNDALENGTRLAAYKAGLERGLSKEQAASIAKNLTTSFNRKGNQATQAGALYAFFNAAIQGTARIGQTVFTMEPGKPKTLRLSQTGKKIVYGGILLGSVQALILAAAGFNEEDPPEFSRERNLIIPTSGKTYVSIPMPLGLHVIPNIGRLATEFVLSGFKDPSKRTISAISLFADAFNPIGSAGLSMQTLAPTALDPLVALTENRDWTGKPIARESSNRAIPGHALGRDTATGFAEFVSEAINTITGGNQHVAGVLSPKPEQIDYLLGQLTGGVGREYSKTEQTLKAVIRGEDLPTYKIPLVGRFVGNARGQASEGSAFYANVEKLNRLETEAKGLREAGKRDEAQALLSSNRESYLITQANYAERQVQKLRKQKSELVKAGAPRDQVRAMEEQVTQTMARLNRAMEALEARRATTE